MLPYKTIDLLPSFSHSSFAAALTFAKTLSFCQSSPPSPDIACIISPIQPKPTTLQSYNPSTALAMATPVTATSTAQVSPEKAVAYAALILADENIPITADKLQTLLKAANLDSHVEPIWTTLFAKALEGKSVKDLLTAIDSAAPAARAMPSGGALEAVDHNGGDAEVKEKADDKADEDSDDGEGMMDLFG